jgi:hypothetical protein
VARRLERANRRERRVVVEAVARIAGLVERFGGAAAVPALEPDRTEQELLAERADASTSPRSTVVAAGSSESSAASRLARSSVRESSYALATRSSGRGAVATSRDPSPRGVACARRASEARGAATVAAAASSTSARRTRPRALKRMAVMAAPVMAGWSW